MKRVTTGLMNVKKAQDAVVRSNRGFMRGMSANRRIVQQVGMQVSDLGVQIAGGQSAILSLTQNVPQVIQMFGAWGGILAGVITLLGTFTLVMVKSGVAFSEIASRFGVVTGEMEAFGRAMIQVREIAYDFVNLVINNLDQLAITIAVVAGWFAGKALVSVIGFTGWLKLMNTALLVTQKRGIMAGTALVWKHTVVKGLTMAVGLLRRALSLLGLPALIIAVGYLAERFVTLKTATGSWGAALSLVGELAMQVFKALPQILWGTYLRLQAITAGMTAAFATFAADAIDSVKDAGNIMIGSFRFVAAGIGEIFSTMFVQISNFIADAINGMVNKFIVGINMMTLELRKLGIKAPILLADQMNPIGRNTSKDGSSLNERLDGIANQSFSTDYMGGMSNGLREVADIATQVRSAFRGMSDEAFAAAAESIPAWKQIMELLNSVDAAQDKFDIRDVLGKGDEDDDLEDLLKRLKRAQGEAQRAVGALGATLSDPVIDMSVDQFLKSLGRLENLPEYIAADATVAIEGLRESLKGMSDPVQVEVEKLRKILANKKLKDEDPTGFMQATQEIVMRIQELTIPIRQSMQDIRNMDPRLKEVNFDVFEKSLTDAVGLTRREMDDLREILGEIWSVDTLKIPEIDTSPVKNVITDLQQFIRDLGTDVESSIKQNFKSLLKGATSLRDALANILDKIADRFLDFGLDMLFEGFKASGAGSGIAGFLTNLLSFDGGGYTGPGGRSGGIDGKGGFLAMLHPNETVIDHEKNKGAYATVGMAPSGGGAVHVNMVTHNNFNGVTREEVMRDVEASNASMERRLNNELPSKINKHRFNQRRGMA
jgi:hypothetical protein